ncbi:MAG TPA: peptidylprolyl isomerase [Candidatus Hydrogenedentes bacterium]|nr:peptidylprolyl isomerase [Candidatus Hydrogenedentota bacterium]
MAQVKERDTVKAHYTGKLEDGTVFGASEEGEPIEFEVGAGKVIPGFEKAVIGMEPGDKKVVEVGPQDAFGAFRDDLVMEFERDQFPKDADVKTGKLFEATGPDGRTLALSVVDVQENKVVVDANHPLAGKDLTIEVELVEIL